MHVDRHPLDYFDFEGVISPGHAGSGDVTIGDWGTWTMTRGVDPIVAVGAGGLHFDLDGGKLRGHFALVRRGPCGAKEQWLMMNQRDAYAVPGWHADDYPRR